MRGRLEARGSPESDMQTRLEEGGQPPGGSKRPRKFTFHQQSEDLTTTGWRMHGGQGSFPLQKY